MKFLLDVAFVFDFGLQTEDGSIIENIGIKFRHAGSNLPIVEAWPLQKIKTFVAFIDVGVTLRKKISVDFVFPRNVVFRQKVNRFGDLLILGQESLITRFGDQADIVTVCGQTKIGVIVTHKKPLLSS